MGVGTIAVAIFQIVVINIVLSGDNAVVIAMACRNLSGRNQNLGIIWGTVGAIVLRVILTAVAAYLLMLPYLHMIGGLALLWIGTSLLASGDDEADIEAADSVMTAIRTIIIADLIMSLDNILGVAAAANGNIPLLIFGLALSIPIVVLGSKLIVKVMNRFPIVVYFGAGVIGYTAGEMLVGDDFIINLIEGMPILDYVIPVAAAAFVLAVGHYLRGRAKEEVAKEEA